jgi:quercetin dioxygenase-like cupin family protein
MLLVKPLENVGDLQGSIYDFEFKGDTLPSHVHTEDDVHITIVARGKLKAHSYNWEQIAEAGQVLNFVPRQPHELVAMEDNTRVINIMKKHKNRGV